MPGSANWGAIHLPNLRQRRDAAGVGIHVAGADDGRTVANLNVQVFEDTGDEEISMFILKTNGDNVARNAGGLTCLDFSANTDGERGATCILPATDAFQVLAGAWENGPDASGGDNPEDWVQFWGPDTVLLSAGTTHPADETDLAAYLVPQNASESAQAAAATRTVLAENHNWRAALVGPTTINNAATSGNVFWRLSVL